MFILIHSFISPSIILPLLSAYPQGPERNVQPDLWSLQRITVLESCQPGLIQFPLSGVLRPQVWSQISNQHIHVQHRAMNMVAEWRWHGGQLQTAPLQGTFNGDKLITMTNETATHCKVPGWNIPAWLLTAHRKAAHHRHRSQEGTESQEALDPRSITTIGGMSQMGCTPACPHRCCLRCYRAQPP